VDFTLSEEQLELQGLAKQILSDRMTLTHLRELDNSEDWFDRDTWAEFAKANLLGIALPESVGGLGYGFLELCLVLQEQGRTVAPLPLLATLVSAALPIAEFGTPEQIEELSAVVNGEAVLTAALTELGTPADQPQTIAEKSGDGWRLTGEKVNVPQAHISAGILVPARVGEDVGLFLVWPKGEGITLERQETMNHEPQFVVKLDGMQVSDAARVGEIADGRDNLRWILDRTMTGLCAISAGAAEEALRITGEKVNVPSAHIAAGILVPARVGTDVGLFHVSPEADGLTLERQETMNHEPQFVVKLDGAQVSDAARVGEIADGRDNLRWILDRTLTGLCAISAGAAEEALRITAEYTTTRKQFDRAIGTFQAVGQRMADSYIDTEGMKLTMLQAATHLAEGEASPTEVATAKYWASEGGSRVGHAALHVHGGISIDLDYPIHRYFLWLKQSEFTLGAATPSLRDLGRMIAASA
jgi:alkylation response protein AidB-like acyl-CoA dehydrogenase